ncbi:MAG: phosphoenolpyruvate---glycerone phosphotransferase subunit DhaL [Chloroflexota bacterium]|jgi:dihydroxyacetone kinase-like protein|nr:phosphoenolpyruvate---glycerone phosphotransferase subunit DhaL [Chloroflexota bacterium]
MLETLEPWLRTAAARIHDEATHLTELDQAIGDGDHGINMDRGFKAIVAMLDVRAAADPADPAAPAAPVATDQAATDQAATAELLRLVGRTLISTVGGASGPLYGTGFLRASAAVAGLTEPVSGGAAIVAALDAAATGIGALGKSTTGEKTMLDALVPAVTAARAALDAGGDAGSVVRAARDAAATGAEATIPLLATKGRASYLGERSIGHQDPGATSAALLLGALADVIG